MTPEQRLEDCRQEVRRLEATNAELLAALKELLAASYGRNTRGTESIRRLATAEEVADAVITKAERRS